MNANHGEDSPRPLLQEPLLRERGTGEADLLGVRRYVVLNPVEAGICERPEEWLEQLQRHAVVAVDAPDG